MLILGFSRHCATLIPHLFSDLQAMFVKKKIKFQHIKHTNWIEYTKHWINFCLYSYTQPVSILVAISRAMLKHKENGDKLKITQLLSETFHTGMMRVEHWQAVGKLSHFLYVYWKSVDGNSNGFVCMLVVVAVAIVVVVSKYNSCLIILWLLIWFDFTWDFCLIVMRIVFVF